MEIAGTIALVTGASSGIGEATARALAGAGAHVVVAARRIDRLNELVDRINTTGASAQAHALDVSERSACEALVGAIEGEHGRLDILVNNAGIPMRRHGIELTVDEIERTMTVNYLGSAWLAMAALPGMLDRQQGYVVSVTSLAGHIPNPNEAAYGASKAALSHWTQTMAVDLVDSGIRFAEVAPGPIETEIWDQDGNDDPLFEGRKFPPSLVADDIVDVIRHDRLFRSSPRRFGVFGAMYPLMRTPFSRGLARFGAS
ncbi:MAG: SDR family oxidoreductase, partial [Nitriliruptorales bacterium]|nr:SDR family oxidoreductase [Nitriliruptorales bacterium]